MKSVLATFVFVTVVVLTHGTSFAQQPAPAQHWGDVPSKLQPWSDASDKLDEIIDPAEYKAYNSALKIENPLARAQALEDFVVKYPNSIVKEESRQKISAGYYAAGNYEKIQQFARQILQSEPDNLRILAILAFVERYLIKDEISAGAVRAGAENGLRRMDDFQAPEGMSLLNAQKMRNQMVIIFAGTAGFGALLQKDYANASKFYETALKLDPEDLPNNYQMAVSMITPAKINPLGFWYGAKALALAEHSNIPMFRLALPYLQSKYEKYSGRSDWDLRIKDAARQSAPPQDYLIKPGN